MRVVLALALCALGFARARAQSPLPEQRALSVREAVALAKRHNPTLRAALLELESARWDVFGTEAQYEPVLALDGSGSQVATPNVFGGSVRISRVRRGDFGAELRKHLIWGTDLALRLSGNVYKSHFSGNSVSPAAAMGATGVPLTIAGFGLGDFGPVYGLNAKLTLKQPLWRGRGSEVGEAALRQARASRSADQYTRDRVSSELLRDLLTAYWELWYADTALAIQLQSRAVSAKQRDEAAARAASGSLAPVELLGFETQVATRDEDLLAARSERARRAEELARFLAAHEPAGELAPLDEPFVQQSFVREVVEQRTLAESAEIRERRAALELAQIREKTADDPQKPRLDLESYLQTQGLGNESVRDATGQFVGGEVISAFVGFSYEAPLRDRVRRAEAAKARLATQVADAQLREVRLRVLAEAHNALERQATGQQKLALSEQTVNIAARQLAAEQARYQSGSSTPLAVLEAEDKLRSAQLRLARARADLAQSALVLEHLTGELLQRYASLTGS